MFLVILVYALFASIFTTGKAALEIASPLFLVGSRMLIAGILLLSFQLIVRREKVHISFNTLKQICLLAFFTIYLTNVLEFWGLKYLTSSKTCLIYSLSPFLSAILSYFMLGEVLTKKKWAGLIIGFIGFLPILLNTTTTEDSTGKIGFFSLAELAVMGAAFCSVYGWIVLKQVVTDHGCSTITANGMSMAIGGGLALINSYFVESWNPIPTTDLSLFFLYTAILIVISNLICYNLYGYLLKTHSATFMSLAGFTTPLFTALFGYLFIGETISLSFYLSFAIVLFGLLIFYQEELRVKSAS